MTKLRGLAWDHRRCWGPLDASVAPYGGQPSRLEIAWDRRSLYEFGEAPLEAVLAAYDLVVFDHPFIGEIARGRLMVPFDELSDREDEGASSSATRSASPGSPTSATGAMGAADRCRLPGRLLSPGPAGRLWRSVPRSHDECWRLDARRAQGRQMARPAAGADRRHVPAADLRQSAGRRRGVHRSATRSSAPSASCASLRRSSHPMSPNWNPIRCYDHMVADDDVVYVPFAFGYVNYALAADARHLPSPTFRRRLGGRAARRRRHRRQRPVEAPRRGDRLCAAILCSPEYQRGDYVRPEGSPARSRPGGTTSVNAATRDFFSDTLQDDPGLLSRPTHAGFLDLLPRMRAARRGGHRRRNLGCRARWSWLNRRLSRNAGADEPAAERRLMADDRQDRSRKAKAAAASTARRLPKRRSTSWNSWPTRPRR